MPKINLKLGAPEFCYNVEASYNENYCDPFTDAFSILITPPSTINHKKLIRDNKLPQDLVIAIVMLKEEINAFINTCKKLRIVEETNDAFYIITDHPDTAGLLAYQLMFFCKYITSKEEQKEAELVVNALEKFITNIMDEYRDICEFTVLPNFIKNLVEMKEKNDIITPNFSPLPLLEKKIKISDWLIERIDKQISSPNVLLIQLIKEVFAKSIKEKPVRAVAKALLELMKQCQTKVDSTQASTLLAFIKDTKSKLKLTYGISNLYGFLSTDEKKLNELYDGILTSYELEKNKILEHHKIQLCDLLDKQELFIRESTEKYVKNETTQLPLFNEKNKEIIFRTNKIIDFDNKNSFAWQQQAKAKFRIGEYKSTYESYQIALKCDPSNLDLLREMRMALLECDNISSMLEHCKNFYPHKTETLAYQAYILTRWHQSNQDLEKILSMKFQDEQECMTIRWYCALAYLELGNCQETIKCLNDIITLKPLAKVLAYKALAILGVSAFNDEVKQCLTEAVKLDPHDLDVIAIYGYAALMNNESKHATTYLNAVLTINPVHVLANIYMGFLRSKENKFNDADRYIDKALESNNKRPYLCLLRKMITKEEQYFAAEFRKELFEYTLKSKRVREKNVDLHESTLISKWGALSHKSKQETKECLYTEKTKIQKKINSMGEDYKKCYQNYLIGHLCIWLGLVTVLPRENSVSFIDVTFFQRIVIATLVSLFAAGIHVLYKFKHDEDYEQSCYQSEQVDRLLKF